MPRKIKKEPDELVTMTGTKSQFSLIVRALDFYSRILAGQWYELESVMRMNYPISRINYPQIRSVTQIIEGAKTVLFPELAYNSSMGIGSDRLAPDAGKAYELRKWIENWLCRNIPDSHCAGDPPTRVSDQEKVTMSDPGILAMDRIRLGTALASMFMLLARAGVEVEPCKLCGYVSKKGVKHECGQNSQAAPAGVEVSGRGKERRPRDLRVPRHGARSRRPARK